MNLSQQYEEKAKNALVQGDKSLAEQAVLKKVQSDEEAVTYKEFLDSLKIHEETIKTQIETLRLKIDEAKSRQEILIVRKKMADTQKRLSEISGNFDGVQENNTTGTETESVLKKELSSKVSSELARLMSEMNIDKSVEE